MHSFAEVCSVLVKEPYNLSVDEIKKLTPYQVRHVFFREGDDDPASAGLPVLPGQSSGPSPREVFYKVWKDRGLSPAEIEIRWRDYQRE